MESIKYLQAKYKPNTEYRIDGIPVACCSPMAPVNDETYDWVSRTMDVEGLLHPLVVMTREVQLLHPHMGTARLIIPDMDYYVYVGNNRLAYAVNNGYTHIDAYIISDPDSIGRHIGKLQRLMAMDENDWDVYQKTGSIDHVYQTC